MCSSDSSEEVVTPSKKSHKKKSTPLPPTPLTPIVPDAAMAKEIKTLKKSVKAAEKNLEKGQEEAKALKSKLKDLKASVAKADVLSDENNMLQKTLEDTQEELEYARNQVIVLQERLSAAYKRSGNSPIPPSNSDGAKISSMRSSLGTGTGAGRTGTQRVSIAPSPLQIEERFDDDDYADGDNFDTRSELSNESSHYSLNGIPPTSTRKASPPNPSGALPRGLSRGMSFGSMGGGTFGGEMGDSGAGQPSMQRRVSSAFSQRLSAMDGPTSAGGRPGFLPLSSFEDGGASVNGGGSVMVGGGPIYREKDTILCKRLSEWLIKSAGIVPSRAANYAVLLVQNGHANTKRLARALVKDEDYLLTLGIEEDDADEMAEALKVEHPLAGTGRESVSPAPPAQLPVPPTSQQPPGLTLPPPVPTSGGDGSGSGAASPMSHQPFHQQQQQQQHQYPPREFISAPSHPHQQQYFDSGEGRFDINGNGSNGAAGAGRRSLPPRSRPLDRANTFSPPRSRLSMDGFGLARNSGMNGHGAIKRGNTRQYNRQSSGGSLKSLASFSESRDGDFLSNPEEGSSPDKAFREARRARLEKQASRAAELAKDASHQADRFLRHSKSAVASTTPHVSARAASLMRKSSRTSMGGESAGNDGYTPESAKTKSAKKRLAVAQAHEKAYLASTRARDAMFLAHADSALMEDSVGVRGIDEEEDEFGSSLQGAFDHEGNVDF
jgi:hypothetical protein